MDKLKRLGETIRTLMEGEFSGYIKINFSQGSLGRIEKSEEFEITNIVATDTAMKQVCREKDVQHELRDKKEMQIMLQRLLPVFVSVLTIAGCAATGTHQILQADHAPAAATERLIQPGDTASVHYLCRLRSGEVAAATDNVAESLPKSNIYLKREESGPLSISAISAAEAKRPVLTPFGQRSFEEEIQNQLGQSIVGMKEGERRTAEIKSEDAVPSVPEKYLARLNRVRTQPKVVVIQKHTYEYLTNQSPEIGQAYTYDTDFPGKVESISDKDVTIRTFVTPGTVKETLFGPGRIREEGDNYIMDIDARKGALVRATGMVGRISYVDDKRFTVDFGNAFGGETLFCDVTVEKIADADLRTSETTTR
jgi:FKBP-type peptidyl-prolyl cis-trans isomerase 2